MKKNKLLHEELSWIKKYLLYKEVEYSDKI